METYATRTITIKETSYNSLTLIAKRERLLNAQGKASMRDVIAFLIKNYQEDIANE